MQILPDGPKSDVDFSEILNAIQESKFHSNFKFTVKGGTIIILGKGNKTRQLRCQAFLKNDILKEILCEIILRPKDIISKMQV